eukprot:COSAG03_NODE_10105_length_671_cov_5056.083916_2_plen_41_part_01
MQKNASVDFARISHWGRRYKVNPRIGEERVQIKAYCDEMLE